jgi:enoyl-CoA hydratase/carnithine racemase
LIDALMVELKSADKVDRLRAVIIAASPPIFSAGHDLRELVYIIIRFGLIDLFLLQQSSEGLVRHSRIFAKCSQLMLFIQRMQLPVIVEVKGVAAAAGCQLVASCDIVVAADNAKFSVPG